jgi:hypothetical protein
MGTEWKPFRFQLAMAARLILERDLKLDPKRKRSHTYCAAIDAVMGDPDKAQALLSNHKGDRRIDGPGCEARPPHGEDARHEGQAACHSPPTPVSALASGASY